MKNNFKFILYIIILVLFASVIWIKYDYDYKNKPIIEEEYINEFEDFIANNGIEAFSFTCPAKNETIIYMDDKYLLTSVGELYEIKYNSKYDNGYNCSKVETEVKYKGFYNENLIYDEDYNFYDINNNFDLYEEVKYYLSDLNNLEKISNKYPYIYFYDVETIGIGHDRDLISNKLLVDNKGNIKVYTNYGYPTSLNLLQSEDTEIVFDRLDYMGVILSIFRSNNNGLLDNTKVKYLTLMEEVSNEVYGLRVITNKGMYNEVEDINCTDICNSKLEQDKEFSKYFNNIVYSNGKYLFIKDTPTIIYNIEKYVSAK